MLNNVYNGGAYGGACGGGGGGGGGHGCEGFWLWWKP